MKKSTARLPIPGVSTEATTHNGSSPAQRPTTMNSTQAQSSSDSIRPAAIVALGVAAVTVSLVAIVALGGFGGGNGRGSGNVVVPPPANPSAIPSAPAVTPPPSAEPTAKPTPKPMPIPATPKPTKTPSAAPTNMSGEPAPITVHLATENDADVSVTILDYTGRLVDAKSGTPAEGVSVRTGTIEFRNLDATTLKLTWSDYPIDNHLDLVIEWFDGKLRFMLAQPAPTGDTDSIAMDRELILKFAQPVSAGQVTSSLSEGFDTAS
jgi:hypothetical protein